MRPAGGPKRTKRSGRRRCELLRGENRRGLWGVRDSRAQVRTCSLSMDQLTEAEKSEGRGAGEGRFGVVEVLMEFKETYG